MIKKYFFILVITSILFGCTLETPEESSSLKPPYTFVNPLIGTAVSTTESARMHSEAGSELRGQNFPAVGVPFGMTQWTPQTNATEKKCLPPYYYESDRIQGFRGSHWMSGSCTQDYGSVTLMPVAGQLKTDPVARASAFSHEQEISEPAYYSVHLSDYDIFAEVTALSRSALLRFTVEKDNALFLVIEPNSDEGEGYLEFHPDKNEITGYNPVHRIYQGWGESAGFSGYFVIEIDTEFQEFGIWQDSLVVLNQAMVQGKGSRAGGYVKIPVKANNQIRAKVGTSFTSVADARKNMDQEIGGWDFDQTKAEATAIWNNELEKIKVQGGTAADKEMYYTALYHTMMLPRVMNNADGTYPGFAGSDSIYQAKGFNYYDDFSMWDTFRAVHPLHTIINPEKTADMVTSLTLKAEQGGWLPIFPAWNNYTSAMIGDHAIAMIGDAWMKGIGDFDKKKAYQYMRKNAFEPNLDLDDYRSGKGRRALASYLRYNFIPLEDSVPDSFHQREQVSRTLEYAFDDFVLSQVAKDLGKDDDYRKLMERARNYQHVFDTTTGFVRGKFANGTWITPFDPLAARASFITEGSPFQYTWYVPQDVAGLISLMGGKNRFIERLDTLFDNRLYWHGNEPGHQTAYLYPYAGAPWKTQETVRKIIREEYGIGPGGLSGNEDAGQMSAWLVFSMAGFYPVCPGMPYYVLGSPVFEQITIQVPQNKNFMIMAPQHADDMPYIKSATLNGNELNRSYITHEEIMRGGELILEMDSIPNKTWATSELPPAMGIMANQQK